MEVFSLVHITIALLLVVSILLQAGESGVFGGGGLMMGGENFHTRRGFEKFLFYASFVLLALFMIMNIILLR